MAAEPVVVSGTECTLFVDCDLPVVLIPGIGESTCVVTDVGVECTASGPGGSVIIDGGIGSV